MHNLGEPGRDVDDDRPCERTWDRARPLGADRVRSLSMRRWSWPSTSVESSLLTRRLYTESAANTSDASLVCRLQLGEMDGIDGIELTVHVQLLATESTE